MDNVEQAIRKSHCSYDGKDKDTHQCVGECTITRNGVKLSCSLCGTEDRTVLPGTLTKYVPIARKVLYRAGVSWFSLDTEAMADACNALAGMSCPSCGSIPTRPGRCPCGEYTYGFHSLCGDESWRKVNSID